MFAVLSQPKNFSATCKGHHSLCNFQARKRAHAHEGGVLLGVCKARRCLSKLEVAWVGISRGQTHSERFLYFCSQTLLIADSRKSHISGFIALICLSIFISLWSSCVYISSVLCFTISGHLQCHLFLLKHCLCCWYCLQYLLIVFYPMPKKGLLQNISVPNYLGKLRSYWT